MILNCEFFVYWEKLAENPLQISRTVGILIA